MPIYEYFCPDNNTVYQFYAKSIAQGQTLPKCPDNPKYRMKKMVSGFAITKPGNSADAPLPPEGRDGDRAEDAKLEAAMAAMEGEFANVDENDPKAMGRMMRRMAEMTGEKLDGEMEEVVRKLEEGADPESLEDQMGGEGDDVGDPYGDPMGGAGGPTAEPQEPKLRYKVHRPAPRRDPQLYDYE